MRRVRVVVWLDPDVLERLQVIVAEKPGGPRTRSAVVREACMWLLAREAAWLLRREHYRRVQAERQAPVKRRPADRRRVDELDAIEQALRIARDRGP